MKPDKFSDSDAPLNLGVALGAISLLKEGVFIAMNGRGYPVDETARNPKSGQFTSIEVELGNN
jgi:L-asparaginase